MDLTTEFWREMFKPLKNKDIFTKFSVHKELDTIVWPIGADFAPSFSTRKYDPTIHFSRKQKLTQHNSKYNRPIGGISKNV